jgi:predicted RNase H-like HicB family nuclease
VITEYIEAAMCKAKYEHITAEATYFGKIPGFKGLWASAATKDACAAELHERLGEWIVLSLRMNMALPAYA